MREIRLASLESSESTLLLSDSTSNAIYASDYVLYLRDTMFMARPFDPAALTFSGEAMPLAEEIQVRSHNRHRGVHRIQNGVLAYQTSVGAGGTTLAWFDRSGRNLGAVGERTWLSRCGAVA